MTTTQLKPRPVRKRKQMTEQTYTTLPTLTKVQSHLPEYQLISRDALWEDFKNRMKINNYEVSRAMEDLKKVVVASQPYVNKAVNYSKDAVDNLRSKLN